MIPEQRLLEWLRQEMCPTGDGDDIVLSYKRLTDEISRLSAPAMSSGGLLPCPLPTCGCEAELGRSFGDPYYVHSIECSECGLTLSVACVDKEPPKSLLDLWNTRTQSTPEGSKS